MTDTTGQLGTIVSWRVPGEVSIAVLRGALATAGFDTDLAADMAAQNALRRALHDMRKGRVIRQLDRRDNKLSFQFTREYLDAAEIKYRKEARLELNVETGALSCESSEIKAKARELLDEHQAKRLTSDLTRLLHKVYATYSADLIPIREQGGAYFVPNMHSQLVERTRTLLQNIDGRLRSFEVRLGSDDTAESVAESMSEYLSQLVDDFKASCEDVDGSSRKDVKERRMETVGELRRKLELYRGLLSGYADHIGDAIQTAEKDLLRKLAEGTSTDA